MKASLALTLQLDWSFHNGDKVFSLRFTVEELLKASSRTFFKVSTFDFSSYIMGTLPERILGSLVLIT